MILQTKVSKVKMSREDIIKITYLMMFMSIIAIATMQLVSTSTPLIFVSCFTVQPRKSVVNIHLKQQPCYHLFMTKKENQATESLQEKDEEELKSQQQQQQKQRRLQKHHTLSVCMVPPPSDYDTWNAVTKARTTLRDPGLYRWPPHVNLLYPFVSIRKEGVENSSENGDDIKVKREKDANSDNIDKSVLLKLRNATHQIEPFYVALDSLGTFGNPSRGVLWLYPRTFRNRTDCNNCKKEKEGYSLPTLSTTEHAVEKGHKDEPIYELQKLLEHEFPICSETLKQREFIPHMTLSHFLSLEEANTTMIETKECWTPPPCFLCKEIYLLERSGDDGQFKRVATLSLGAESMGRTGTNTSSSDVNDGNGIYIHDPPLVFPGMPCVEEEWVRQERMDLKARRNNQAESTRRRGRGGSGSAKRRRRRKHKLSSSSSNTAKTFVSGDSPEVIAQKRAQRKAKRERQAMKKKDDTSTS